MSHRYTGQILDEETGLYYYNARYYDPELGRFIQPDSIVPDEEDSQSLNRYTYVRNNPLNFTDPSGHSAAQPGIEARMAKLVQTRQLWTGSHIPSADPPPNLFIGGLPAEVYANAMAQQRLAIVSALANSQSRINRVDTASPAPPLPTGPTLASSAGFEGGGLLGIAKFIGGFIPGVSSVISFADAFQDFRSGHVGSGIFNVVAGLAGLGGAGGLVKAGTVVGKAFAAKVTQQILKNNAVGKNAESILRGMYGGKGAWLPTKVGWRQVDNLTADLTAMEAKVGEVGLTPFTAFQAFKDRLLVQSGAVNQAEWHFFNSSATGIGPTPALKAFLNRLGIQEVPHPGILVPGQ